MRCQLSYFVSSTSTLLLFDLDARGGESLSLCVCDLGHQTVQSSSSPRLSNLSALDCCNVQSTARPDTLFLGPSYCATVLCWWSAFVFALIISSFVLAVYVCASVLVFLAAFEIIIII